MINYLAALGWNDGTDKEIYQVSEIVEGFDVDRVNSSPSMFDMAKLKWVNGQHIRAMEPAALKPMVKDLLVGSSDLLATAGEVSDAFVGLAVSNTQDKIEVLTDAVDMVEEVLDFQFEATAASEEAAAIVGDEFGELTAAIVASFDAGEMPTGAEGAEEFEGLWKAWVKKIGKDLGRKGMREFDWNGIAYLFVHFCHGACDDIRIMESLDSGILERLQRAREPRVTSLGLPQARLCKQR